MKRILTVAMMAVATAAVAVEPAVSDVMVKQRFPWNGLVDIDYTITGDATGFNMLFSVRDEQNNKTYTPATFLTSPSTAEGTHRVTWSSKDDGLSIVLTNIVVSVLLTRTVGLPEPTGEHEKIQLWEGGPYWAMTNIGAEKPEDYGYYFWWGDTIGYKRENGKWVATDGSSSNFSFSSDSMTTYGKRIDALRSEEWITVSKVLTPEHDAVHAQRHALGLEPCLL